MVPKINSKIVEKGYLTSYEELFNNIHYTFKNIHFLLEALSHPSSKLTVKIVKNVPNVTSDLTTEEKIILKAKKERDDDVRISHKTSKPFSYERLEFLGDRVLGLVIGEALLAKYPNESEGDISKKYSSIVCGKVCAEIAKKLKLDKFIVMSIGEEKSNGRDNSSNLENALEALIGAIFLDSGLEAVKEFIQANWKNYINNGIDASKFDPKSFLQQWSQMYFHLTPTYTVEQTEGPDHAPSFTVSVKIPNINEVCFGSGKSKKDAEKDAAQKMIDVLKKLNKM